MWRRPGTVQTIGTSGSSGQGVAPAPVVTSGSAEFTKASTTSLSTTVTAPSTDSITYEWWFRPTATTSTNGMLTTRTSTSGGDGIDVSVVSGGISVSTSGTFLLTAGTVLVNTWYHIALVRNGTTNFTAYLNGTSIGTFSKTGLTGTELRLGIKTAASSIEAFGGYISNFRYVKGTAVYTGAFTPPTAPLTVTQSAGTNISAITAGQTQLLLNTVDGANFLVDSSSYTRTVTNNNGVTSAALNPF